MSAPGDGLAENGFWKRSTPPRKSAKVNALLRIDVYPRGFTFRCTIVHGRGGDDDDTRLRKRLSSTETVLYNVSLFFLPRPAGHNGKLSGSTKTAVIHLFSPLRTRRADNDNNIIWYYYHYIIIIFDEVRYCGPRAREERKITIYATRPTRTRCWPAVGDLGALHNLTFRLRCIIISH